MKGVGGFVASAAAFVVVSGFVIAFGPHGAPPKRQTFKPDNAIAANLQRYQARLSADGTVPPNAVMEATRQRDALLRFGGVRRAGVSPATFTSIGPTNVGGRIRAIYIDPTNVSTIYVGTASGGIWKTTDAGATWVPQDDFMATLAVSCFASHPSAPNTIYAGTGEGFWETQPGALNTAAVKGAGIFKTTDGGANWTQMPQTANPNFEAVNRIAISPVNPNLILAATSTGLWRTIDGGMSWGQASTEWVYDVDFNPTDPNKAVMGVHEFGVYYSTNAGATWTNSVSIVGHRAEVAYCAGNPNVVYATVGEADVIRPWKSTDGGVTFTQGAAATISTYSAYNNCLWVNPTNENDIIYGGVYMYRSTNGGASRTQVYNSMHADMHAIVSHPGFNGGTNKTVYMGTDGGLYRVNDFTVNTITKINGLGITQFYGAVINPVSGRVYGGTQDNYTQLYTGNANGWQAVMGGDGGYAATDPADQNYYYGTVYWAYHFRSINGGTTNNYIYNTANPITDAGNASLVNFINWMTLDPNNSSTLLAATNKVWRTTNAKAASPSWFVIKPELPLPRGPRGGGKEDEAHFTGNPPRNVSYIAVAPGNSGIIWVGHNNGRLFKTVNGTATTPTWTEVVAGLPQRWISGIHVSPQNANTVYVAYMGWEPNNLWRTTDGGVTWNDVSGLLPSAPISCVSSHPSRADWLYVGTDIGMFTSSDTGASWSPVQQGPATVPVEEIRWRNSSTMLVVTHGRGCYLATVNSNEEVFSPNTFALVTGSNPLGRFQDILTSDNFRQSATQFFAGARNAPTQVFEAVGTCPIAAPSTLKLIVEAQAAEGGTQRAYLWNYATNVFDQVDSRAASAADSTITITISTNAANYVGPGGQVRAQVGLVASAASSRAARFAVDLVYWRANP